MDETNIPPKLKDWIAARERHNLSHAQVQMARELGFSARKLGRRMQSKAAEPFQSIGELIDANYLARFKQAQPDEIRSIEERSIEYGAKKAQKAKRRLAEKTPPPEPGLD